MRLTTHSKPGFARLHPGLSAILVLSLVIIGCNRDKVTQYNVTKDSAPAPAPQSPMPGMPPAGAPGGMGGQIPGGGMGSGEVPPPPRPANGLKWTLPKGWTEGSGGGMRFATLKPAVAGKVEVSVVVLPGPAGGELNNVNRWRGQIGLPPIDEAALDAARKTVKSKLGPVSVFDFTSDGQAKSRMVTGLITSADGNTWFLKLTGDADPVGKAKADFMKLLETLRLD